MPPTPSLAAKNYTNGVATEFFCDHPNILGSRKPNNYSSVFQVGIVGLTWVIGRTDVEINEKADELVSAGAVGAVITIDCLIPFSAFKNWTMEVDLEHFHRRTYHQIIVGWYGL